MLDKEKVDRIEMSVTTVLDHLDKYGCPKGMFRRIKICVTLLKISINLDLVKKNASSEDKERLQALYGRTTKKYQYLKMGGRLHGRRNH